MRDVFLALQSAVAAARPSVYCRLVETRGSTPQKPGAVMLVFADGSQAGTLGGGCVEAEVKRYALRQLEVGVAAIHRFTLDSDYGWDDGLICGGRMQVLVAPITPVNRAYYQCLTETAVRGDGCTEAITLSPDAPPQSLLFDDTGTIQVVNALRAPAGAAVDVDSAAALHLRPLVARPRPYTDGGFAYLPLLPRCRLLIVGGGHVGQEVARWASDLDFDVTVVDDRAEYVTAARFPSAVQRLSGPLDHLLPEIPIDAQTYCLVVTRGHNHDKEALFRLVQRGARYVGMIGSRRKIKLIYEALADEGIDPAALRDVHAPLGIEIGSQTVSEIAVSICAELVAHRNCHGHVPGRPPSVWEEWQRRGS
jgi:xanthine dehydrogenase accessory factor